MCIGTQEYYRDVYDHLIRINQTIDSLRDMVTTAISVNLSLITLQENETTKRLAAYARAGRGADHDRRHLRHELQAHAGARLGVRLPAGARHHGRASTCYLFFRFRKAGWL